MSEFMPTALKLTQREGIPEKTIEVPSLKLKADDAAEFFTLDELMLFRKSGSNGAGLPLKVSVNPAHRGAAHASTAVVAELGGNAVEIDARRLTGRDKAVHVYGKCEVILAAIAVVLAILTIVGSAVTPSAEQKLGRAELAAELQPIEQRLAIGVSTHDAAAIQNAQRDLDSALGRQVHASSWAGTATKWLSIALTVLSAVIVWRVATKKAKLTP